MPLATWGKNLTLDAVVGDQATIPATWYLGLVDTEPSVGDDGSAIDEVSGGSYARVAVTNDSTEWGPASGGQVSNLNEQTFPTATADWGRVRYVVLLDSATLGAGNLLGWGLLSPSRTVLSGQSPKFAAGALTVTVTT